jgi:hypothetical protein
LKKIAPNHGFQHGIGAIDAFRHSPEGWRLRTHRNVLADKQQQLAAPAERDATRGAGDTKSAFEATYALRWSSLFASISFSRVARRASWAASARAMTGATAGALARPRDRDFWMNNTILPMTVAIEAPAETTKNVMYGTLRSSTHCLYVYFLLSRRNSKSPAMSYSEANKRASDERPNKHA